MKYTIDLGYRFELSAYYVEVRDELDTEIEVYSKVEDRETAFALAQEMLKKYKPNSGRVDIWIPFPPSDNPDSLPPNYQLDYHSQVPNDD